MRLLTHKKSSGGPNKNAQATIATDAVEAETSYASAVEATPPPVPGNMDYIIELPPGT